MGGVVGEEEGRMGAVVGEEERGRLDQFKSWHDEAFLYIQQAVTQVMLFIFIKYLFILFLFVQEEPGIGRRDVALMMYQRGLGLLDLALCVDTGGPGPAWAGARGQQAKMGATRAHVEGRVRELTDLLAPPLAQDTRVAGRWRYHHIYHFHHFHHFHHLYHHHQDASPHV